MTETRTESAPPTPGMAIGQAVGQAESVLSRLLAGVLAETGTAREAYLAIQRLTVLGDNARRDDYVHDLADWLDIDPRAAAELTDRLVAEGLLAQDDDMVRLASAGVQRRERVRDGIGDVMAPVWAPFDRADLETTARTLREITLRARALYPVAVPAPAREAR